MFSIILCTVLLVLILIGIWHEEKLIAFEDKLWAHIADRIGYIAAKIYLGIKKVRIKKLVRSTNRLTKRLSRYE